MEGLQIVWFKRDLRIHDHRPLQEAAQRGPVLPLHVVEPELWAQPDASGRQWSFCAESLSELREELAALGQPLVVRVGDVTEILGSLHGSHGLGAIWSHEETGNGWTYRRDRRVAAWARARGIPWEQRPRFGVVRRLGSRDGWARRWQERMARPCAAAPDALPHLSGMDPGPIPAAAALGLAPDPCPGRQTGGRRRGLQELDGFLERRGRLYHRQLSSPLTAFEACSRLSAHLAFGTLSLREVVQAARRRRGALGGLPQAEARDWRRSIDAFLERLHWHCHFIQKLESEPELEFRDLHPAYAGLRRTDPRRLEAWAEGRTGWPFLDACMRALRATGWINFRMRAMVMTVASYQLWIDWRDSGLHLARMFVDYEPGIHWSQCQMQSASTGINTVRIYNPVKQGLDQDPEGRFIRQWVPELTHLPTPLLHQPWTLSPLEQAMYGCVPGRDYPWPVVDHLEAARLAREKVWAVRKREGYGAIADRIQERHGSRRGARAGAPGGNGRRAGTPGKERRAMGPRAPAGEQCQLSLDL